MSLAFIFWLILILTLLFGVSLGWPRDAANRYGFGTSLLLWVLLALLGWATFGSPIRG